MAAETAQKDTPAPVTVAKGGRGSSGVYAQNSTQKFQDAAEFFEQFQQALSPARIAAYKGEPAQGLTEESLAMARYLLNMALCESLYASLHLCEIGLRNAIHRELTKQTRQENWFDCPAFQLKQRARNEIEEAKQKVAREQKPITPDSVISSLNFGFWTNLFDSHYVQYTKFLPAGIKGVFPHLPKSQHHIKDRRADLEKIRQLRNRVFHHERIIHWKDLDSRHQQILDVLGWINPSLQHMVQAVDRFADLRHAGLKPWIAIVQANLQGVGYGR